MLKSTLFGTTFIFILLSLAKIDICTEAVTQKCSVKKVFQTE